MTNGLGGFASGTIAGTLTRRYHGLLIAALKPPLQRTLLVAKLDESVTYRGVAYEFATNRWHDDYISPRGFELIERFELDGTTPVWRYAVADALIEKRVWMEHGANVSYVTVYCAARRHAGRAAASSARELPRFSRQHACRGLADAGYAFSAASLRPSF